MAKLQFNFGVMGSSKSANALMTRFNYIYRGCEVLLIKPALDTRDYEMDENGVKTAVVHSRIGLSAPVDVVAEEDSIYELLNKRKEEREINVVIVDEAQFLTPKQVDELADIAAYEDIPCLCYGLRTDFQSKLFPGSQRLMELAKIREIEATCGCMEDAVINARVDSNGNIITEGDQVDIGGNEKYEAMCWRCWRDRIKRQDEQKNSNKFKHIPI